MFSFRLKIFVILFLSILSANVHAQFKLYEKGHDSYKSGDYSAAVTNFTEFLSKPTHDRSMDPEVRYLLALSYYKQKDYKNSVENFEEALLLNYPNKGNMYWFMAKCYDNMSKYTEATDQYTNAIKELGADKNTKAKLLYERSGVHTKSGNLPLALGDLRTAASLTPENADIRRDMDKLEKQGVVAKVTQETPRQQQPAPQVKKDEPVVKKQNETVKNNDDVAKTNTSTQQEQSSQTDDLIANRLRSSAKKPDTETGKTTGTETAKTNTESVKATESPVVVSDPPSSAKKTVTEVVNPIADAYKEERRFALVIGNSKYPKSIGVLKNPVNDATDIAQELEKSHFDVQLLTDATYGQMRAAMLKFKEKVDAGEKDKTVALFYYAGHGLAHDDENYLVPIDAMIEYEDDIARYCFGVQRMVLANMERSNSRMNIVILDACRNNPFPALTRSAGQQGLSEMKRARGSFIAYATAPGSVASDGSGRNGLYTQELLKAMRKPGLTIEQVFKEVRASVGRMSGDKQNTWDSSNIVGEFYFKF